MVGAAMRAAGDDATTARQVVAAVNVGTHLGMYDPAILPDQFPKPLQAAKLRIEAAPRLFPNSSQGLGN
jgi:hypothetical protein